MSRTDRGGSGRAGSGQWGRLRGRRRGRLGRAGRVGNGRVGQRHGGRVLTGVSKPAPRPPMHTVERAPGPGRACAPSRTLRFAAGQARPGRWCGRAVGTMTARPRDQDRRSESIRFRGRDLGGKAVVFGEDEGRSDADLEQIYCTARPCAARESTCGLRQKARANRRSRDRFTVRA